MKRDDSAEIINLPPHGRPPADGDPNRLPCRQCGASTLKATLSQYGALCFECYEHWCRSAPPAPDTGSKLHGPKSWAWALKRREESGERLTIVQKQIWRDALRFEMEAA